MEKVAKSEETVEIGETTARYTTNAIASVAFGIDINCFADPDTPFRKYGRQTFEMSLENAFRVFCFNLCPSLLKLTCIGFIDKEITEFLLDVVKQTLELREENNIVRKDFFQLLVQLRNSGTVQLDDEWQTVVTNDNNKSLTLDEITAQSFIFYAAGFGTSSGTMSFCLYEIAKNDDIQRTIQEEIDTVLALHDRLASSSIWNAGDKLFFVFLTEAFRKYPVVPLLNRIRTRDYTVPEMGVTIEKGTPILIPVLSLQRDEQFYPNSHKFDPTRFLNENKNTKTTYLPFGDGPRNYIGNSNDFSHTIFFYL